MTDFVETINFYQVENSLTEDQIARSDKLFELLVKPNDKFLTLQQFNEEMTKPFGHIWTSVISPHRNYKEELLKQFFSDIDDNSNAQITKENFRNVFAVICHMQSTPDELFELIAGNVDDKDICIINKDKLYGCLYDRYTIELISNPKSQRIIQEKVSYWNYMNGSINFHEFNQIIAEFDSPNLQVE